VIRGDRFQKPDEELRAIDAKDVSEEDFGIESRCRASCGRETLSSAT